MQRVERFQQVWLGGHRGSLVCRVVALDGACATLLPDAPAEVLRQRPWEDEVLLGFEHGGRLVAVRGRVGPPAADAMMAFQATDRMVVPDRRAHPREAVATPVRVTIGDRVVAGRTVDLSVGGSLLELAEELEAGRRGIAELDLAAEGLLVCAISVVRGGERPSVRFEGLGEDQAAAVNRTVAARQRMLMAQHPAA